MWSYYWDEKTNRIAKCLCNVLMSYQWEIGFCYRGSKIRYLIRNLLQNHSSFWDTIKQLTINFFLFNNLVPRFPWLSDTGRRLPSNNTANMPWEPGCIFSYSAQTELRSLMQVSHVRKKIKNRWVKKATTTKKKSEKVTTSLKLPLIYPSNEWLHYHLIHGDGRRESHGKEVPWSCSSANCRLCGWNKAINS